MIERLFPCGLTVALVFALACKVLGQIVAPAEVPDSLRLRIVIPADGDTVAFEQIRYAGSAAPGSAVRVQGERTRVHPSGAFAGIVPLEPEENLIVILAEDALGTVADTVRIFRQPPPEAFPVRPTHIDPTSVRPSSDMYLAAGELLDVQFVGSPGGIAVFSLEDVVENVRMIEVPAAEAGGLPGVYRGVVRIPYVREWRARPVKFKLRGVDGRTVKVESAGKVRILSAALPLVGVMVDSATLVRNRADGVLLAEVPAGVEMEVIGESGDELRVRLAESVEGSLPGTSLRLRPPGAPLRTAAIGSIGSLEVGDWVELRARMSHRAPFRIEQSLNPSMLVVYFYRAQHVDDWITHLPRSDVIHLVERRHESKDIAVLRLELNQTQPWGFFGEYRGNEFRLRVRKTPQFSNDPEAPLKGLIIAVDPGHGGENRGAVGATGLEEKTVNLKYAMKVADLLQAEGATVIRTRTTDTTMTLGERVRLARDANAHLFVWLHNNSVGLATDPLRVRGTSTYYTIPQAMPVAEAVYARLLDLGLHPFGKITSSFLVTRQTSMISFLVEGAFLSHPEDEMLLMDDHFLSRLAVAVVEGIKDFVRQQPAAEMETNGRMAPESDGH